MTWFTDSIYERLMTEKPKCGRPEKEPPVSFSSKCELPLQGKVPMHRLLYQENKRKKRTGALERIRYETYYM